MNIAKDIIYVGVNDKEIDLFEGQYIVPNGMAYNSYVILSDKVAVLDSVDKRFAKEWLANIKNALDGRVPDYFVVHHMEPDHSGSIYDFMDEFKETKIVSSAKAFVMMKQFFGTDFQDRQIVVGENDVLNLGEKELAFFTAPMVHWPEVIMSYEKATKTLFSADAFGKFGALDADEEWACEARRYYFGIVGKYGQMATALLKKLANVEVSTICPLHGPVLNENLGYYLDLYNTWCNYLPETKGVAIFYTSVYGNTEKFVKKLSDTLEKNGENVTITNLARCDMAEAVEDAFRYDRIVLATTTYNAGVFPFMHEFINHLTERNFQNKKIALIENGSWAPTAVNTMKEMLAGSKNIEFLENSITIKSAMNDENIKQLSLLADELKNC